MEVGAAAQGVVDDVGESVEEREDDELDLVHFCEVGLVVLLAGVGFLFERMLRRRLWRGRG